MNDKRLYLIGQMASIVVGIAMSSSFGFSVGLATAYLLLVLVDIRYEIGKGNGE